MRSATGNKLIVMLQGAQYADGLKASQDNLRDYGYASGITRGIGKSLELLGSLASHADQVPDSKPERKLTDEEMLFQRWKP